MFGFTKTGDERGDCTTPYAIVFDEVYTVREFVQAVLSDPNKWGYIGIKNEAFPFFGNPMCEYRYGKLLNCLPDDVMGKKVVSATADGGWSNMDYLLTIENENAENGDAR